MQEVVDRYEKRRLLPHEVAGEKQVAMRESIEWKYQICYLFTALGKQDESVRGVCDDPSWLMQQFAELLRVPRYALIKKCPLGRKANFRFQFHPLIYEEKVYSSSEYDIIVTNCNDDSLITTLTGHTNDVLCLTINDGKLYSGSYDNAIKIWNGSTDTLIKTLTGHTGDVRYLTISDGRLYSGSEDNSIKVSHFGEAATDCCHYVIDSVHWSAKEVSWTLFVYYRVGFEVCYAGSGGPI